MRNFIFTTGFVLFSLDRKTRRSKDWTFVSDLPEKDIFSWAQRKFDVIFDGFFFLLLLTLVSLMLYFLELCPPNIRSNSDLCMLTFTDHYFSMHLRSGAPDTAVVLTETLTGSVPLLFHCLLVSLKVWHWICEKGDQLCSVCEHCYLCIFHIEPLVSSVFFVSPSALLSEFVAFSMPGPLLCHTVSGSGLMGQIVLFHDCMLLYEWLQVFWSNAYKNCIFWIIFYVNAKPYIYLWEMVKMDCRQVCKHCKCWKNSWRWSPTCDIRDMRTL